MSASHTFATTSSRVLGAARLPKTPEPFAEPDAQPPSPPRPRLRLRKRTASHLIAPTQQFLASVAAADVPIPSIEEPEVVDEDMIDSVYSAPYPFSVDCFHQSRPVGVCKLSSPKTPAPGNGFTSRMFPDWHLGSFSSPESSPEYESSRPSTARSTQTSSSFFSHLTVNSEDLNFCISPELDQRKHIFGHVPTFEADRMFVQANSTARSRKAPWSREMSHHLWTTYMNYLQDPKLTPFRIGRSGIPPHGVCARVARVAKRTWASSKFQSRLGDRLTVGNAGSQIAWTHTHAATLAHLRELCMAKAGSTVRDNRYMAHSPTPFGRTASRFKNRRSEPAVSKSVFSSSDMAMSLTMSTSESMQLQGPLAQLTGSQHGSSHEENTPTPADALLLSDSPHIKDSRRLGSPFGGARSYGPSSTNNLEEVFQISIREAQQPNTAGPRVLGSPASFITSRHSSQKRPLAFLENRTRKRPSLGSDFWVEPPQIPTNASPAYPLAGEFSSTASSNRDAMFVPRTNIQQLFEGTGSIGGQAALTTARDVPPRLGSPFVHKKPSFSVPNRFSSPSRLEIHTAARKQFATVQPAGENSTTKKTLKTRLAYIDQRLRDFRRQDQDGRRSQSPQ